MRNARKINFISQESIENSAPAQEKSPPPMQDAITQHLTSIATYQDIIRTVKMKLADYDKAVMDLRQQRNAIMPAKNEKNPIQKAQINMQKAHLDMQIQMLQTSKSAFIRENHAYLHAKNKPETFDNSLRQFIQKNRSRLGPSWQLKTEETPKHFLKQVFSQRNNVATLLEGELPKKERQQYKKALKHFDNFIGNAHKHIAKKQSLYGLSTQAQTTLQTKLQELHRLFIPQSILGKQTKATPVDEKHLQKAQQSFKNISKLYTFMEQFNQHSTALGEELTSINTQIAQQEKALKRYSLKDKLMGSAELSLKKAELEKSKMTRDQFKENNAALLPPRPEGLGRRLRSALFSETLVQGSKSFSKMIFKQTNALLNGDGQRLDAIPSTDDPMKRMKVCMKAYNDLHALKNQYQQTLADAKAPSKKIKKRLKAAVSLVDKQIAAYDNAFSHLQTARNDFVNKIQSHATYAKIPIKIRSSLPAPAKPPLPARLTQPKEQSRVSEPKSSSDAATSQQVAQPSATDVQVSMDVSGANDQRILSTDRSSTSTSSTVDLDSESRVSQRSEPLGTTVIRGEQTSTTVRLPVAGRVVVDDTPQKRRTPTRPSTLSHGVEDMVLSNTSYVEPTSTPRSPYRREQPPALTTRAPGTNVQNLGQRPFAYPTTATYHATARHHTGTRHHIAAE